MTVQALLAGAVPWGWGRSSQLPSSVLSQQDQTSTTLEPSSMGTLIPLAVPSRACSSRPELGLVPWDLSRALCSDSLSPGMPGHPLPSLWPWIPHVPETTHIPHFAKNGQNCRCRLAGGLAGCSRLFWCCLEGPRPPCQGPQSPCQDAAGSGPGHHRQLGPGQLRPSPLLWPARPRAHPCPCLMGICTGYMPAASAGEPAPKQQQQTACAAISPNRNSP